MKYILAHDLGTSGDKASVYDGNGILKGSVTYNYPTSYPQTGWAEQDPESWWKAVCDSTKSILQKEKINPEDVACISFSGQMMGCLPVDREGNCLRKSIIWADMRAIRETERLKTVIGKDTLYNITGTSIAPNYSLEKILWIKNNENEVYKNAASFLNAKDFIVYRLTGRFVTDYSDASGTNILDINKKVWSDDIIKASGIDEGKLPELCASTDIAGYIIPSVADEIGLTPGTAVVPGGGDGPCATIGAGAVEEGDVYNYFGSSSWISFTSAKPVFDPNQRTFNLCLLDPDYTMAVGTMQSAGGSYEWMKDNICNEEKKVAGFTDVNPFDIIGAKASASPPGSKSLIFLPYLLGERCPYWNPDARGAFIGLTRAHTKEDIIRSVYEGPIFNLKVILELFKGQGFDVKEIRAIGGAVRSDLLCRIMASIFELDVLRPVMLEEATSFGAAMAGAVAVGIFKDFKEAKKINIINDRITPNKKDADKYRKLFPIFKAAYEALVPVYDMLAEISD